MWASLRDAAAVFPEQDMFQIVERIHEGKCVPFLGAGVNVSSRRVPRYRGLLLANGVARCLKSKIKFVGKDPSNLAQVSLQYEMDLNRDELVQHLTKVLPDSRREPSPLLRTLARLPLKLIVTTNYDRLMEKALKSEQKEEGRDYLIIVQPEKGWDPNLPETRDTFDKWRNFDGLLLYKIHGTFQSTSDAPPPITITEEDYIQFLATFNHLTKRVGIPDCVTERLIPSTLLFLGYGLHDWNIRAIYKGLVEAVQPHRRRNSFAIEKSTSPSWAEFWSERKVRIRNFGIYEFGSQLEAEYFARYPADRRS